MSRNPQKATAKTVRTEIAALQKKLDARQEIVQKNRDDIKRIKSEIRKRERLADQLARNEFASKVYALSVKHQIPFEDVLRTFSFLNELKADPEQGAENIRMIREMFRSANNDAGLAWIDAVECLVNTI